VQKELITFSAKLDKEIMRKAFTLMCTAKSMTECYERNFAVVSRYVHATSRGHEAIQIAAGLYLKPQDYLSAYYRDDCLLLAIGLTPYELMLQLMAKRDDPFSGGRLYYSHPSLNREDMPKIPMQSSATGMQAIPATGLAMGIQYLEFINRHPYQGDDRPVVLCSLGDGAITEGEVSEAFQMAILKKLPIIYLVQDNGWDISAKASEIRAMDASEYARGFKGLEVCRIDRGYDFPECFEKLGYVFDVVRRERRPFLVHARVPLLNHHTSGVRKEWYRDDLVEHEKRDPYPFLRSVLAGWGISESEIRQIEEQTVRYVEQEYKRACAAEDPRPQDLYLHDFAPTPVTEEKGQRQPAGRQRTVMVDCALYAIRELMEKHPECVFYGQDVGRRLGGVFREAATLAEQFGDHRVFNTPIQEAFIIGSTVGMSIAGCKPIVEVQFADYIWPGLNQLFTEVSRSCYLSNGKWPVSCVIRVPTGAYGCGGPYHSSSVESVVLNIKGIKVAYPSTGADLKGLIKAAFYDPNPVVIFEHKGLYWSKIKGTEEAKTIEPDADYVLPLGKGRLVKESDPSAEVAVCVITYGMGVYWALEAAKQFPGLVEIVDLRSLNPLDEQLIYHSVKKNYRCLVLTEETWMNSFAEALSGRIARNCFPFLDAPVELLGAENLPAIPLNSTLEETMIPNAGKVAKVIDRLLGY
jgi:2-oxoisovalerate dehydrogenase E1 component